MAQSNTADIMDRLELYGGKPAYGLDEADNRPIPQQCDIDAALGDITDIITSLSQDTMLDDVVEDIIKGWVTALHYKLLALQRELDKATDQIKILSDSFDGSEVADLQLIGQQNLAKSLAVKAEVIETMRDCLAALLESRFGAVWHPPRGNHVSRHRTLSQAVVEARSYLADQEQQKRDALLPTGTKIGFAGGKNFQKIDAIWDVLDKVKSRYPDMVLVHGNAPGAEHIAGRWADNRQVRQIIRTPDWKAYGKAAPFRRNDEMLKLGLQGLIATTGTGITENLVDKAQQKYIKLMRIC